MATPDEDRKARPNSFGDAAAATAAIQTATKEPPQMFNRLPAGAANPQPQPAPVVQTQPKPGFRPGVTTNFVPTEAAKPAAMAPSTGPQGFNTVNGGSRPMTTGDAQALANQNRMAVAGAQAMGFQRQQAEQAASGAASAGAAQSIKQAVSAPADVPMFNQTKGGPFGAKPTAPTPAQVMTPAKPAPVSATGTEAELLRLQGVDVRDPNAGAAWKAMGGALDKLGGAIARGFNYNSDVAAAKAAQNYGNEGRNYPAPAVATAATNPAGPTSTTMPVGEPARNVPGNNQPNPVSAQSPSQNPDAPKQDPMTGVAVNNQVRATRQPNGVMEFSGTNVAGDVTYTGNSGFKPSGAGVTVMPSENFTQAMPSTQAAVAQAGGARGFGNGSYFNGPRGDLTGNQNATVMSGKTYGVLSEDRAAADAERRMYDVRPGEGRSQYNARINAMTSRRNNTEDNATSLTNNAASNDTQRRGQDVSANTAAADRNSRERMEQGRQGIDAQRLGLDVQRQADDRTANGFKIRAAEQQERLFTEWANAKTPEEKASAAEKLRMLQGGGEQRESWGYAPGRPITDENGTYETPGVIYNKATGETREVAKGGGQARAPEAAQQRPVGTTSNVNGKMAVWDGKQWIPQ